MLKTIVKPVALYVDECHIAGRRLDHSTYIDAIACGITAFKSSYVRKHRDDVLGLDNRHEDYINSNMKPLATSFVYAVSSKDMNKKENAAFWKSLAARTYDRILDMRMFFEITEKKDSRLSEKYRVDDVYICSKIGRPILGQAQVTNKMSFRRPLNLIKINREVLDSGIPDNSMHYHMKQAAGEMARSRLMSMMDSLNKDLYSIMNRGIAMNPDVKKDRLISSSIEKLDEFANNDECIEFFQRPVMTIFAKR